MARLPLKTTLLMEDAAGVNQVTRSRKVTINFPGSNWKRTNLQLASLACGLALATVVAIGGSQLLRNNGNTGTNATGARVVSQSTGSIIDPSDFGSLGIEFVLAQQAGNAAALASVEEAQGIGQPGEGVKSSVPTFIDPTDFGSMGVAYTLSQSEATRYSGMADAVYATESWQSLSSQAPLFGAMIDAGYVIETELQLP